MHFYKINQKHPAPTPARIHMHTQGLLVVVVLPQRLQQLSVC